MQSETTNVKGIKRAMVIGSIAGLSILIYGVVAPFLTALLWAVILAYALWPLHRRFVGRVSNRPWISALAMTFLVAFGIAAPLWFIGAHLTGDLIDLAGYLRRIVTGEEGEQLATRLEKLPLAGETAAQFLRTIRTDPEAVRIYVAENRDFFVGMLRGVVSGLSKNVFTLVVCLFTTYFLFLRGENMAHQLRLALVRLGGERMDELLNSTGETVRGVVYGLVFTAIAQAIVAALGFWIAGVPYPILLGGLMLVMSFIPFGPVFVWLPASITLLARSDWLWGGFVFVWGMGVISTMDNIFRPIFIGRATRMPVLLVFIGVVGGMLRFGLLGLFVGPVLMAIATSLWRYWIAPRSELLVAPPSGNEKAAPAVDSSKPSA